MNTDVMQMTIPTHPNYYPKATFHPSILNEFANRFFEEIEANQKTLYNVTTTYPASRDFPLTPVTANYYLKRFHRCLLTYLADSRNIQRAWFRAIEPMMYSFLDIPNSKPKNEKRISRHDSSFHHHSILIASPEHASKLDALTDRVRAALFVESHRWSRPKETEESTSITDAVRRKPRKLSCTLKSLKVQRVGSTLADITKVTDYASHYARNRLADTEMMQVFPISHSEFKSNNRVPTANELRNCSFEEVEIGRC